MNIISNAIDALEASNKFSVFNSDSASTDPNLEINTQQFPTIRVSTELTNHHTVKIWIVDNGSGISTSIQQKIFDPFFTTKPVGQGTGLGLSISYQIIADKHKGQLICNSALGKGSEFLIEIPV
jgi:signal transduction histidine kinase